LSYSSEMSHTQPVRPYFRSFGSKDSSRLLSSVESTNGTKSASDLAIAEPTAEAVVTDLCEGREITSHEETSILPTWPHVTLGDFEQYSTTECASSPADSEQGLPEESTYAIPNLLVCDAGGCGSRFTGRYRKGNYARHRRQYHGTPLASISCEEPDCLKTFKRKDARLKHYRKHHPLLAVPAVPREQHMGATYLDAPGSWAGNDSDVYF
jgi:hypothetical protein